MLFGLHGSGAAFIPTVVEYQTMIGGVFPCPTGKVWAKAMLVPSDLCTQPNRVATAYLKSWPPLNPSLVVCGEIIFSGPPMGIDEPGLLDEREVEDLGWDLVRVALTFDEPTAPKGLARSA